MRLTLHNAGDHNGNAFPIFSSSSSSSSSYLGESSPESLQSLSSLSGGRTDSPLDYDMLEVTLMTTVVTEMTKVTDVVISKWETEEDSKRDNNDDVSVGKIQRTTELSESNDNSVSVYLDANSSEYHQDTWNDNDLTQALSLTANCNSHDKDDDLSSRRGRRHGSTTPDSDVTEVPADGDDDDDDEEEALFLSLSSDLGVQRSSLSLTSSTSQFSDGLMIPGESAVGTVAEGVANGEGPEVTCPLDLSVDSQTDPPASEDIIETTQILSSYPPPSNPAQDPREATSSPDEAESCAVGFKSTQPHTSHPVRAAKNKSTTTTSNTTKTVPPPGIKPSTVEAKRVSTVDLKNVRAKVGPPNVKAKIGSPSKTPIQVL